LIGTYGAKLGTDDMSAIYGSGYQNVSGEFYLDIEGVGSASEDSVMQPDQVVAGVVGHEIFMGLFGLGITDNEFGSGPHPAFLEAFYTSTIPIPSLSYGYTSGASYREGSYFGSLTLGGVDSTRFTPPKHFYPFSSKLTTTVQSIIIDTTAGSESATLDTSDFAHGFPANIDTTLPYFWFPGSVCDRLEQIFALTYDNASDLYLINDTMRQRNLDNRANITMKFAESITSPNFTNIVLPYQAFDLQASWPIFDTATRYFPIRRAPSSVNILGRTLLQEAYLTVDYGRQNFSLSQATFGAEVPTPKLVPITTAAFKTQPKKAAIGTAAIAGITVAGAIVLLTIIAVILFCRRRHRRRLQTAQAALAASAAVPGLKDGQMTQSGSASIFSEGSELGATTVPRHRRVSELSSPDSELQALEYFGHRKGGSKDTTISELEVLPQIHELPGDGEEMMPRPLDLGVVKEEEVEEGISVAS
jgi:hypothetical protein